MLERMNGGSHEELANWALGLLTLDWSGVRSILDVGCGGGANLERLMRRASSAHVCGVDYAPLSVALSREVNSTALAEGRCEVVEGNVCALPFESDTFDVVTAFETVYFWPRIADSLREVRRVLVSGGWVLIANDADGDDPATRAIEGEICGMRVYGKGELRDLLERAGFSQVRVVHDEVSGRLALVARSSGGC